MNFAKIVAVASLVCGSSQKTSKLEVKMTKMKNHLGQHIHDIRVKEQELAEDYFALLQDQKYMEYLTDLQRRNRGRGGRGKDNGGATSRGEETDPSSRRDQDEDRRRDR